MSSELLPEKFLQTLEGVAGFDKESFVQVHESGEQIVSVRFNPFKNFRTPQFIFPGATKVPWSSEGYYLPFRPSFTLDPLLHAGAYYVQEASGMFIEQCMQQHAQLSSPTKVLDLCAAPGGKSTLIHSLLPENSLLVSNEVIKTRVNILTENITKWGAANVIITNNDPRDFARLHSYFDVMIVDAPCSGSGLFRRDRNAIEEWSDDLVHTCSLRQQRILTDALPALKPDGLLIYSTCSYSTEEDEEIADWLVQEQQMEALRVEYDPAWNITETRSRSCRSPGYRFFPDKTKGEGFYVACFRRHDDTEVHEKGKVRAKFSTVSSSQQHIPGSFLSLPENYRYFHLEDEIFAFPTVLESDLHLLAASLYIRKAGVRMGKLLRGELIPDHELALSTIINDKISALPLEKAEALQYLRKEEVVGKGEAQGWALAQYEQYNLGWVKILKNRVNNYYPKEWRILKTGNS